MFAPSRALRHPHVTPKLCSTLFDLLLRTVIQRCRGASSCDLSRGVFNHLNKCILPDVTEISTDFGNFHCSAECIDGHIDNFCLLENHILCWPIPSLLQKWVSVHWPKHSCGSFTMCTCPGWVCRAWQLLIPVAVKFDYSCSSPSTNWAKMWPFNSKRHAK